jgi:hypothetical protein
MQYDPSHLQDAAHQIVEPQNLTLLNDLNDVLAFKDKSVTKKADVEVDKISETTAATDLKQLPSKPREFILTSEILDTILEESKILSSSKKGADESSEKIDVHQLG